MNPRNRLIVLALAGSVAVGCGKNNDENNANGMTNGSTNGMTNGATNGMTNGMTNGATNGMTNGSTNNNTNMYTPFDFMCPNNVTPAGVLADAVGTWDIGAGCVGENNFGLLDTLCPSGVLTNVAYDNWAGRMVVRDDGSFASAIANTYAAEVYVPQACADSLGDGTCPSIATFVDGATGGLTTTTCVDEGTNGDCYCTLTGDAGARGFGVLAEGANAGEFTATSLELQDDGSYLETVENWELQTDGTAFDVRDSDTTSSYTGAMSAMAASDCEFYCHGFMALCNENDNVTPYTDTTDCLTQCAGFDPGTAADMAGDTLGCRMYHLGVAGDSSDVTNPDTHCVHAQAAPTAVCM